MKSKYLSAAAALLCAAGLAACGGKGNGSMSLGVQVYGLDRAGLVVSNGGENLEIAGAGEYYFKTLLPPDTQFNVSIKSQPKDVDCILANNSAKINYYTYRQTTVNCTAVPYILGGTVVGLGAENSGLVLANGAQTVAIAGGATTWQFSNKVSNGLVYGVTVLAQPAGKSCTITGGGNGTGGGTMPARNIDANDANKVVVTCQSPTN
jgi:hypothetical protein